MSQTNIDSAQIPYQLNILQNITSLFIYSKRYADRIFFKCSVLLVVFYKIFGNRTYVRNLVVKTPDILVFQVN